jgi:hypothetical protein
MRLYQICSKNCVDTSNFTTSRPFETHFCRQTKPKLDFSKQIVLVTFTLTRSAYPLPVQLTAFSMKTNLDPNHDQWQLLHFHPTPIHGTAHICLESHHHSTLAPCRLRCLSRSSRRYHPMHKLTIEDTRGIPMIMRPSRELLYLTRDGAFWSFSELFFCF